MAHSLFSKIVVEKIRALVNDNPVLDDLKGIVDLDVVKKNGIYYRKQ